MIFIKVVDVFVGVCYLIVTERNESNEQETHHLLKLDASGSKNARAKSAEPNPSCEYSIAQRAPRGNMRYLDRKSGRLATKTST